MTPEETVLLQHVGNTILTGGVKVIPATLLYGTFIPISYISAISLLRQGFKNRAKLIIFMINILNFALATICWVGELGIIANLTRLALVKYADIPLDARFEPANRAVFSTNLVATWTNELIPLVSDAVVIWRAWAILKGRRWVIIGPLSLLIGTAAIKLTYLVLTLNFSRQVSVSLGESSLLSNLLGIGLALSTATNALTTLLISFKLWSYHKSVVINLGPCGQRSLPQKILMLLVESGFVYCVVQIITLTLNYLPPDVIGEGSATGFAAQAFYAAYPGISVMYPAIVIILVERQRSIVDTYMGGTASGVNFGNAEQLENEVVHSQPITQREGS